MTSATVYPAFSMGNRAAEGIMGTRSGSFRAMAAWTLAVFSS